MRHYQNDLWFVKSSCHYFSLQRQKVVFAPIKSQPLLPFVLKRQYCNVLNLLLYKIANSHEDGLISVL